MVLSRPLFLLVKLNKAFLDFTTSTFTQNFKVPKVDGEGDELITISTDEDTWKQLKTEVGNTFSYFLGFARYDFVLS